jgi:hypothetical protein
MPRTDPPDAGLRCPSARCEPGAVLLGIVGADGRVGYITPELRIDDTFVSQAHEGRVPEKRFRFSQACVAERCVQWTGSRCGVIDRVMQEVAHLPASDADDPALPKCSIRPACRWFAQSGPAACRVCPLVITDLREPVTSIPGDDSREER